MAELYALCKAPGCGGAIHQKGWCAACFRARNAERQRRYRERHPGLDAERQYKRYWAKPVESRSANLAYYYRNRDKVLARKRLRYYGITAEQYQELWDKQNGCCGICGSAFDAQKKFAREVHVDHCHTTGLIRGLLCGPCNRGLGSFRDNPAVLVAAKAWLEAE